MKTAIIAGAFGTGNCFATTKSSSRKLLPGMPDMQPRDVTLEFILRIATAIDDLESLDSFE
jgi:hypothetical protein